MVTDLDFEEIDDLMGQMSDTQELTEAIAADVAKVSPKPKAKKPSSKSSTKKPAPKKVVVEDEEPDIVIAPKPKAKKTVVKEHEDIDMPESESVDLTEEDGVIQSSGEQNKVVAEEPKNAEPEHEEEFDGTKVAVRVLTKYAEEPEEPVYKPNPKVGRFMDFVDPKNDMVAARKQPNAMIPVATVIETHETIIETVEEIPEEPADDQPDRDRLEKNGLDPDATVEEMMEMSEPEDGDEFLEEMMNSLGEDIEDEVEESAPQDDPADIIKFPDRSDAFLSEVDIEKRPLGGSAVADSVMVADEKEMAANEAFINDEPNDKKPKENKISKREQKRLKKATEKQMQDANAIMPQQKKKGRAGQAVLYVFLILLLAILGGSLGALAYFSGLF